MKHQLEISHDVLDLIKIELELSIHEFYDAPYGTVRTRDIAPIQNYFRLIKKTADELDINFYKIVEGWTTEYERERMIIIMTSSDYEESLDRLEAYEKAEGMW